MSIYTVVAETIQGIIPGSWRFVGFESISELPDVTSVTLKVRSVSRLPKAPMGAYQVDWVVTITSPYTSRETADPELFDDLVDFLIALDTLGDDAPGLVWTGSAKTVSDDLERLAYDITISTITKKDEA